MRFVVIIAKLTAVYVSVQVLRLRCRFVTWRIERMRRKLPT